MRYINHGTEPNIIANYKTYCQNVPQDVTYDSFYEKQQLNDILRREQGNICCYCMQRIDHFQGEDEAGSHNEHLIPQHGENGQPNLQMEFANIYACCNYTKRLLIEDTYCGWHKCDNLIPAFIQQANCRRAFKYNIVGEILPNGIYERENEYFLNENILPQNQNEALQTIRVLNLNQAVLKKEGPI